MGRRDEPLVTDADSEGMAGGKVEGLVEIIVVGSGVGVVVLGVVVSTFTISGTVYGSTVVEGLVVVG